MATTYKTLTSNDIVSTRTLLHEAVPITGTIVSGTYNGNESINEQNIKNYSHGMFQSVYDYPFLSSSANHIFDLTVGYSNKSALSGAANVMNAKKINVYNQMAQVLAGFDHTGSVREFDKDGDYTGGAKIQECIFINFSRLLTKDEIKKGSFTMSLGTGGVPEDVVWNVGGGATLYTLSDYSASTQYKVNSPAGEYGILYSSSVDAGAAGNKGMGLIYYQAGIAIITGSIFSGTLTPDGVGPAGGQVDFGIAKTVPFETGSFNAVLTGSNISSSCDGLRNRIYNIQFDNTTELNSTIHFCRANHNDFNYSSNPTYLSGSKVVVKESKKDEPVSYVTGVGLYSADNELLAVAKVSEPLKKTPSNELTLRVRLDY
tara:strand:- start:1121 stop:2239 length:1119 start_codon:yes stop_codon:yes gene_type:complete